MTIEPDTKDWTWVLERPCPDCGFDASVVTPEDLPGTVTANATGWAAVLLRDDAQRRPAPQVWSPLEYACHVRDVHRLFGERVRLMLDQDDPAFANWDQDVTAVEERYDLQDPAVVSAELVDTARRVAATYAGVSGEQWQRTGRRSNGSLFTVDTLGRYHLHDVVHHLWDVGFDPTAETVAAYDAHAAAYADGTATLPESVTTLVERFADLVGPGGRVLEIGSGQGRDAAALEAAGLSVRRSDISAGFVGILRDRGLEADVLDPLVGDLSDPGDPGRPYDGVWASASLLHVARSDLPVLLGRLGAATRSGGVLHLAVKEGDGDVWSTHGHVAAPRLFVLWREGPLSAVVAAAGWDVLDVGHSEGRDEERWLDLLARRR